MSQQKITGVQVAVALDSLTDVNAPSPATGYLLSFDGANWIPVPPTSTEPAIYTYTASQLMLLTHRNAIVRMDSAGAVTYTIRTDANVAMPVGATVVVSQQGTGTVTIAFEGGVTVVTPETLDIRKQYGKVTLTKTAVDYWEVEGNLTPV